ncbi:energy-coupling factor transporter ATPase [Salipaludibacillus agaradhaerens]|uniref:energy-coupling factor transporter ATPase n=1 Tax=Salipaludibacillus agaradhaerens TaxID=76935 RepID=UPI0021514102|nr:energy-coupling factor transporter ATPase [Salipaludibacillus agaradhaerens]MCR6104849.1 energy-coupling factor transporter ATPase [Salipaludibacillus agaradhaerens]MCR6116897.1 energy-coupling factor transporter ATPase [Salipaludibacillus agaradhaerens]
MSTEKLIEVKNVSFRYRDDSPYVVKGISLSIKRGEWLTILGHNGSGKSTLAKMFNALYTPNEGDVISFGHNTKSSDTWTEIRRQAAMVFQNPDNQIVAPTVEDDVAFGLENAGVPYEDMRRRVSDSISRLGLEGLEKREPHQLSGGQKQRVALAGALALKPAVIILDEATSMLDPSGRAEVLTYIKNLHENENMTIITITHDVEEAVFADRLVVLKDGQVLKEGTPAHLLTDVAFLREAHLKAPFTVQLTTELKKHGVDLQRDALTREELVEALWIYKQTH